MLELFRKTEHNIYANLYRSGKKLQHWVQKNSGSREDAEDVVQEAVIVCKKYLDSSLDKEHKLEALFLSIGQKIWFMELRKRKLICEIDCFAVLNENSEEEESIHREEMYRILETTLSSLGNKCQILLKLFYYNRKSMDEIAIQLNLASAQVAKASKYKCLEKAREMVKNGKS